MVRLATGWSAWYTPTGVVDGGAAAGGVMDVTIVAQALQAQAPAAPADQVLGLAQVLAAVQAGQLTPAAAQQQLAAYPAALHALTGHDIRAVGSLLSFGAGNQFGNISIGDRAGRDVVKLTVNIYPHLSQPLVDSAIDPAPPLSLPDLFPPADTLIGQRDSYTLLCKRYQDVVQTRRGRLAFISGPPGYGRRALAQAVGGYARQAGAVILHVRFWPTARLAPEQIDRLWDDDPLVAPTIVELEQRLVTAWPRAVYLAGRGWVRLMAQAQAALGQELTPSYLRAPDEPTGLGAAVRQLVRMQPVVVLVEDLDNAPDLWLDLLKYLTPELTRDWPALFVGTLLAARPLADLPREDWTEGVHLAHTLADAGRADAVWLGPVSVADAVDYIGPAQPVLARRLVELTGGWPTVIESLWREWCDAGAVIWKEADGVWTVGSDASLRAYGTLREQAHHWVAALLGAHAPFEREQVVLLLTCAALEGPTFTAQAVARVLDLDADEVMEFFDEYLLGNGDQPGVLCEVGFVPDGEYSSRRYLNLYRFTYVYLWNVWREYEPVGWPHAVLQRRVADALEAVYYPDTDRITAQLIALFEATGQSVRAEPYRERGRRTADLEGLRYRVGLWEAMPLDDFEQFRLFELRLQLSSRLYERAQYQEGYAQVQKALEWARVQQDELREARALNLAGLHQHAQGFYTAALPLYARALAIREQVLGPEHPDTATSLNSLGLLLQDLGDLAGARPYYERALAIRAQALGPDHPNTATSLNNLGALLRAQGDLAGARPSYERALAIRAQALGPDHPATATSLNNLGALLQDQGDLAGARPSYERALSIWEQALGPDHPNTATSLHNLGFLLQDQGELAGARPYYERALAIREQVRGPDHPDTALSLHNLGRLLQDQGDLAGARPYLERALAIYEQVLGPAHPHTQTVRQNLAVLDADLARQHRSL
ncbi:MAG: tetratricopeptide repeat protein [Chloroflexales bacterium]|nr:tetratricopeptide repeat protein [Chloroflexales bacterium]